MRKFRAFGQGPAFAASYGVPASIATMAFRTSFASEAPMKARLDFRDASPDGEHAMRALHMFVRNCGLEHSLLELIKLRASQINGCAHCIDIHSRDLIKSGMSVDKLVLVPVWEEASLLFSNQERAALAWTEEVTLVSETHASDEAYAAALSAFGEKDLVELTIVIAAMNAINRMGISFRMRPLAKE
jgi:AhpD family alkylhydroperoxidase